MEAFALSLAVVPFLASRLILGVCLLISIFAVKGFLTGGLSWQAAVLGVLGGFFSLGLQLGADYLRKLIREIDEIFREWVDRARMALCIFSAVCFAARNMGLIEGPNSTSPENTTVATVALAGFPPEVLGLLVVGVAAWAFATLRTRLGAFFAHLPLSEIGGLSRWLLVVEALWTLVGLIIAVLFPLVGAALAIFMFMLLAAAIVIVRRAGEGARGSCSACGHDLHLAARRCAECGEERAPSPVGLFGRVLEGPSPDADGHRHRLLTLRRCPDCAERIRKIAEPCTACGSPPLADEQASRAFVRYIDRRMAALMPVFVALTLVPGFGLVFALAIYKLGPPGALGGYLRWRGAFGTRLLRGMCLLLLAVLQPVPLVGVIAGVGLLGALHLWSRRSFLQDLTASA